MSNNRASQRFATTVPGSYRTANGTKRHIRLTDLSRTGARIYERHHGLLANSHLRIMIGPLGYFPSVVRWSEDHVFGIQFVNELYAPVMDHIRREIDSPEWR